VEAWERPESLNWNDGRMEHWNIGLTFQKVLNIIPLFQHSNIPILRGGSYGRICQRRSVSDRIDFTSAGFHAGRI
jgi:hypothetical protein